MAGDRQTASPVSTAFASRSSARAKPRALPAAAFSHWESSAGNLWAGTIDGGVSRYRDGRFTAFSTTDGLMRTVVRRIDEDAAGAIWAYHDTGVSTWRDGRWQSDALPPAPIPGCTTGPSFRRSSGMSWGTGAGTTPLRRRYQYGRWSELPLPPGIADPRALKVGWIREDFQRQIWLRTCSIVPANPT